MQTQRTHQQDVEIVVSSKKSVRRGPGTGIWCKGNLAAGLIARYDAGEMKERKKERKTEKYEASCGAAHSWLRGWTELGRRAKQAVRQAVMTAKKSSRS